VFAAMATPTVMIAVAANAGARLSERAAKRASCTRSPSQSARTRCRLRDRSMGILNPPGNGEAMLRSQWRHHHQQKGWVGAFDPAFDRTYRLNGCS
jgi:hypothetical protein